MPEFSDLIEDLVKDIEPEAAFEALALFQEDEVLGLQSVFEKAAKTPKDRRTPQFLRKISNEVDTVVGVFGRRDAWLRESSVYSDSVYVQKACFDTFVGGREVKRFRGKRRKNDDVMEPDRSPSIAHCVFSPIILGGGPA